MKKALLILMGTWVVSCSHPAESVIDLAIEAHGSKKLEQAKLSFDFRGKHYDFYKNSQGFSYHRSFSDTLGNTVEDVFTNVDFQRKINNELSLVADTMASKYSSSINSVAYFMYLPLPLLDEAVNAEILDEVQIKNQLYHCLKVTFNQNGGGEDFQDEYRFWINQESGLLDYLAYNYQTNGGGIRFRAATNQRYIKDVVINDYKNYGFENLNYSLDDLPRLYEENKIPLLSEIKNENVNIEFYQP